MTFVLSSVSSFVRPNIFPSTTVLSLSQNIDPGYDPVSTQHCFDVDTTLFGRQQRCYNVEATPYSCRER